MTTLSATLAAILGGQATPEECALVTDPLFIRGARDLSGIEHFVNVEAAELLGCEVESLEGVAAMPRLRSLRILCSSVRDIAPLARCARLHDLELNFTLVEDIAPLLDIASLHVIRLFGNPLSQASYDDVLPRLAAAQTPYYRTRIVEVSPRREWAIARTIRDAGLEIAFGSVAGSGVFNIVRPGIGTESRVVDFLEAGFDFMEKTLQEDPNWAKREMFSRFFTQSWVKQTLSRFRVQWMTGNHRDAHGWVDAGAVETSLREGCFAFISGFNREPFFIESDEYLGTMADLHRISIPTWWRQVRSRILAGIGPAAREVHYRLDTFQRESITRNGGLYRLGWIGYYNDEDRRVYHDRCGIFPIGDIATSMDYGKSMLAINIRHPDDRRIYEFWPRSLHNAVEEGENPMELVTPVFDDWGVLLSHVTEVIADGSKVERAP